MQKLRNTAKFEQKRKHNTKGRFANDGRGHAKTPGSGSRRRRGKALRHQVDWRSDLSFMSPSPSRPVRSVSVTPAAGSPTSDLTTPVKKLDMGDEDITGPVVSEFAALAIEAALSPPTPESPRLALEDELDIALSRLQDVLELPIANEGDHGDWDSIVDEESDVAPVLQEHLSRLAERTRLIERPGGADSDWELTSTVLDTLDTSWSIKWMAEVRFDDPRVPSPRVTLITHCFQHRPVTRHLLSKHLAEQSFEFMDLFLEERRRQRRGDRQEIASLPERGDGAVLAELLQIIVEVTVEDCAALSAHSTPAEVNLVNSRVDLLVLATICMCRARPILDVALDSLIKATHALVIARPFTARTFVKRLLSTWPSKDSQRHLLWLKLTGCVLLTCPAPVVTGSDLHIPLMKKIKTSVESQHAAVATTALDLTANMHLMLHYVLPFPEVLNHINKALIANREHWNAEVTKLSDEQFDKMLDYS